MNEALIISQQTLDLCIAAWKEASDLFKDEDINSPPNIIEHEKVDKILVTLASN